MNRFIIKYQNLLVSVAEITVGILLLINPVGLTSGIIIAFGVVMTVIGVWNIIGYFQTNAEEAKGNNGLSKGLFFILIGLFCIFKSEWFIITFPIITVFYGLVCLLIGFGKLQQAVDMLRCKKTYWYIALISALLTLSFATLILTNPFASTAILWIFIGVSLIIEAVMDVFTFIVTKKKIENDQ
jgi:uncharacterized membrane protein HdeD (DUF308 family)